VIATDRALVPVVRKHLEVSDSRITVVPNAVDLEEIDRLGVDAPSSDLLLLSVGRLEHNKGFDHLVGALAALARQPSTPLTGQWRCVIVGEGSARGSLERRIADANLQQHVSLPGRAGAAELHNWYEAATLFVHPTLYEGSSIVTLEAMAHRRAVVGSNAGGIPDKVRPGVNGWLVEPGDEQGLMRAIEQALADRNRLIQMGREGRAIVEREFSWKAITDRVIALYDEILTTSLAAR
jgi:glycosyltransferase involved in cell wall biosynthesis